MGESIGYAAPLRRVRVRPVDPPFVAASRDLALRTAAVIESPALSSAETTVRLARLARFLAGPFASSSLVSSFRAVRRSASPVSCAAASSDAFAFRATRLTLAFVMPLLVLEAVVFRLAVLPVLAMDVLSRQ